MATEEAGRLRKGGASMGLPSSHPFLRSIWKRQSIWFYGLCVLLDEISTFLILALGGRELNPRLLFILEIHPILWTLMDIALLLSFVVLGRTLKFRGSSLLPVGAGVGRLLCFLWNTAQIVIFIATSR